MNKVLTLALVLVMVLALCACGGDKEAAPAEAAAPAQDAPAAPAAPEAPAAPAAPAEPAGDASGEPGAPEEGGATDEITGPIEKFDMVVNAPVIGQGASEIFAVGRENTAVVVDFTWSGPGGEITRDSGVFQEGDYTVTVTFKAADGYEMTDPVSVKLVGGVGTDYMQIASSGTDANGVPVYEMKDVATLAAGAEASSAEPSGEAS